MVNIDNKRTPRHSAADRAGDNQLRINGAITGLIVTVELNYRDTITPLIERIVVPS